MLLFGTCQTQDGISGQELGFLKRGPRQKSASTVGFYAYTVSVNVIPVVQEVPIAKPLQKAKQKPYEYQQRDYCAQPRQCREGANNMRYARGSDYKEQENAQRKSNQLCAAVPLAKCEGCDFHGLGCLNVEPSCTTAAVQA